MGQKDDTPMAPEGMNDGQRAELRLARELHRPLARSASVARGQGRMFLLFGTLGALSSLPGLDWVGLAIGALVICVGVIEVRTSPRMSAGDLLAPRILARSELVLMGGIIVYCLLKLYVLPSSVDELVEEFGNTSSLGIDIGELTRTANELVYMTSIIVTLIYQGLLARYFLRKQASIDAYLKGSKPWARELLAEVS